MLELIIVSEDDIAGLFKVPVTSTPINDAMNAIKDNWGGDANNISVKRNPTNNEIQTITFEWADSQDIELIIHAVIVEA